MGTAMLARCRGEIVFPSLVPIDEPASTEPICGNDRHCIVPTRAFWRPIARNPMTYRKWVKWALPEKSGFSGKGSMTCQQATDLATQTGCEV